MRVVITDYQFENLEQEFEIIRGAGHELEVHNSKKKEEIISAVRDADAVMIEFAVIDKEIIDSMEKCRMIIKYGVGVNTVDIEAASRRGIYVCNVPDYGVDEVSNHAITMILMLAKKIQIESNAFRAGEWGQSQIIPLHRFAGSTVGLAGFGRIPRLVAKKLKGFEVKIVAFDPYVPDCVFDESGVEKVGFDALCSESDYISVHCPLNSETRHMFSLDAFRRMKPSCFFVNTSRGPVVDEDALVFALENKLINGAGIDVYEHEPLAPDSRLFGFQNVILTPHCAWYSEEAVRSLQKKAALEVVNVLAGNMPFNCVNLRGISSR